MSERAASHLSEEDLHRLRAVLSRKRDDLVAAQRAATTEQRDIHDRESEPADLAEGEIEQAASLRLVAFDASLLAEVDRALKKIEDGQYGFSEDSGEPIPLKRLEAVPWARRTTAEEARKSRSR